MLSLSLLLAAFLLAPVAPSPVHPGGIHDPSSVQCARVTVTVTVTETVGASTPSPTGDGVAISEQYSPVAPRPTPSPDRVPPQDPRPEPHYSPRPIPHPDPYLDPDYSNGSVPHAPSAYRNALYFTNWGIYGANFQPQQLPAEKVTHVLYAFADIAPDGEVKSSDSYADTEKHYPTDSWNDQGNNAYGCVKQLYLLKKQHRSMKVLLSIGGWTYSPKFPPIAATESGRQKFASSAVKLVKDWGLDGLDIDWEYPANAVEARNFVLLLKTCRQALDDYAAQSAPGYHFLITIAAPAGSQHYSVMDLPAMDPLIDAWHLMAYDYAGSWDSTSGHQSNIYSNGNNPQSTKFSTEQAVRDYMARGIPSDKIVLGLPLYGRAFEATEGLGQSYNGIGPGSIQAGVYLYKDLPRPGAKEMYDDVAQASYSYDAATKELVSYDTVDSALAKAKYLVQRGLGGAVFWEASGDKSGGKSLVSTVAGHMGKLDTERNLLSYPASQYDNIRAGMPGV